MNSIVVRCAQHKATHITVMCKDCRNVKVLPCKPGIGGAMIPRYCDARQVAARLLMSNDQCCDWGNMAVPCTGPPTPVELWAPSYMFRHAAPAVWLHHCCVVHDSLHGL